MAAWGRPLPRAGHAEIGLDEEQMETALGIAARQAHGPLVEFATRRAGRLQCGQAAMAGLTAAMLAQRGFESAPTFEIIRLIARIKTRMIPAILPLSPAPWTKSAFFDTLARSILGG